MITTATFQSQVFRLSNELLGHILRSIDRHVQLSSEKARNVALTGTADSETLGARSRGHRSGLGRALGRCQTGAVVRVLAEAKVVGEAHQREHGENYPPKMPRGQTNPSKKVTQPNLT